MGARHFLKWKRSRALHQTANDLCPEPQRYMHISWEPTYMLWFGRIIISIIIKNRYIYYIIIFIPLVHSGPASVDSGVSVFMLPLSEGIIWQICLRLSLPIECLLAMESWVQYSSSFYPALIIHVGDQSITKKSTTQHIIVME